MFNQAMCNPVNNAMANNATPNPNNNMGFSETSSTETKAEAQAQAQATEAHQEELRRTEEDK